MFRVLRYAAVALALVALTPGASAAQWTQVRSANFLFVGDASERHIRETAQKLEQFRDVMIRVLPGVVTTSSVPTIVFVFASDHSFAPYQPRREGQRIKDVSGYFQQADTVNYIAMNAAGGESAFRLVFHEYTHFLISHSVGETPAWFGEGLAQVYETLEVRDGGRTAILGAALAGNLQVLQQSPMMPLDQLIRVNDALAVFHAGGGQRIFYAQSWALMHYLMLGNETRASQLRDFVERVKAGNAYGQAFADAIEADPGSLEPELRSYVRRILFPARRFTFGEKVTVGPIARGLPIADAEAQSHLGDLLARIGRTDDARARLRRVLEIDPGHARAAASLGSLELRSSRFDEALPLLERAAAAAPDDGAIQSALGMALYEGARRNETDRPASTAMLMRARTVLARAVQLAPGVAPTLVALAYAEMGSGGNLSRARALVGDAIQAAPSRLEYRLALADVAVQQGDVGEATRQLNAVASRGSNQEVRDEARAMLEKLIGGAGGTSAAGSAQLPASTTPSLRVVQDGETRVRGRFIRMECGTTTVVFHIETDGGALRLHEPLGGVRVISYRPGAHPSLTCGPVPGAPFVLATYRPAPTGVNVDSATRARQGDGIGVAIEIVPEGFVLP